MSEVIPKLQAKPAIKRVKPNEVVRAMNFGALTTAPVYDSGLNLVGATTGSTSVYAANSLVR